MLLLARELRLLKVVTISVDGPKIDANASKHTSVRYDQAMVLREKQAVDIGELVARAENADAVEADATMLVLSAHVTNCASDRNELLPVTAGIDAAVEVPETVLADRPASGRNSLI